MSRAGIRFYQVQAQLSGMKGEWTSSRQCPTMIVGAVDMGGAARMVSDLAWAMSGAYLDRVTMATVVEVTNGDGGDVVPVGVVRWVRVAYRLGGIETVTAETYSELIKS